MLKPFFECHDNSDPEEEGVEEARQLTAALFRLWKYYLDSYTPLVGSLSFDIFIQSFSEYISP